MLRASYSSGMHVCTAYLIVLAMSIGSLIKILAKQFKEFNGYVKFRKLYNIMTHCFLLSLSLCAVSSCMASVVFARKQGEDDKEVKIVAVDLQAMAPLPGVVQIQGDITKVTFHWHYL